jgi:hypothetical protein
MRALATSLVFALLPSCAADLDPPVVIDDAAAAGPSSPITCSQSDGSVVVSNGRYRATVSTGEPLVVDALVGGKPGERLVTRDRLVISNAELIERSVSVDRCRSYHAGVTIFGRHPTLPLRVRRTFEFTRSMNLFETIELFPVGTGAFATVSWFADTIGNNQVIAYASTKDLLVDHPGGPLGGMDGSLLAEFSSSVPQTTGALGWTRPITVDIPAGCTFLANQVLQLDGSPTNRLDFTQGPYAVYPFYSGFGVPVGEGSPGVYTFVDFNAYKYPMEDIGPVPPEPGSGLAEDTLIRLGVHLLARLDFDGGWFKAPAWSIYPPGDSFTTNGRSFPNLAYLWAHLALTDSGSSFVHTPGDHDEIYDALQRTFSFLDSGAPEPTFADQLGGGGLDHISYSLHLKEKLGNFGGAVINSHSEALHFITIMIEASTLRGRAADRVGWEILLDVYFPGTRALFDDLYPGHQNGQTYPGLIDYATNQRQIYTVEPPGIDYPAITFTSLAMPYLLRGEYEVEFADVVERFARGDTIPFDDDFEPVEQASLVGALWRAFPPSLALSFSDEAPPRHFAGDRWDQWSMHPHVHVLGGDFDGDGRGDVLKLDVREDGGLSASGGVYVALAQEGGEFATGGPWATWTTYANMKVVTGDFNDDGKTDLMKLDYPLDGSTGLGGLWVGLSTGAGFTNHHWGDWETSSRTQLRAGDFNCDDRTDVMMVEVAADGSQIPDGELRVALSTGTSFDTTRPPWAQWTTHGRIAVMTGDFDGDECDDVMKVDVAADGSAGASGLWVGLSRRRMVGSPPREVWSFDSSGSWGTWYTHDAMPFVTGDFNGDGKTDVAKVDNDRGNPGPGGIHVGLSTGTSFSTRQWASWETHERIEVLAGDFDGNGKTDLMKFDVAANGSPARGGLWVGLSDGYDLTTREWARWDTYDGMKVLAGDFDGDHVDDVLKIDVATPASWLGLWVGLSRAAAHDPLYGSNPGAVGLAEVVRHGPGREPSVHDPALYIVEGGGRQIIRTSTRIYTTWTPGFWEERTQAQLPPGTDYQIILAPHAGQQLGHYGASYIRDGGPRVELMTDFAAADSFITPPPGFSTYELHVRDYIGPGWSAPRFVASGGFSGFVHVGPLARKQLVILRLFP